jgi:hypothetical protein
LRDGRVESQQPILLRSQVRHAATRQVDDGELHGTVSTATGLRHVVDRNCAVQPVFDEVGTEGTDVFDDLEGTLHPRIFEGIEVLVAAEAVALGQNSFDGLVEEVTHCGAA